MKVEMRWFIYLDPSPTIVRHHAITVSDAAHILQGRGYALEYLASENSAMYTARLNRPQQEVFDLLDNLMLAFCPPDEIIVREGDDGGVAALRQRYERMGAHIRDERK